MTKIIAFAGSNSSTSINHQLVEHATHDLTGVNLIRLTDFNIPMYSIDLEKEKGIPEDILTLVKLLEDADYAVIGCPEHNGLMPAFFKNILDWLSRTGVKYLETTPILLLSAAPGKGGAKGGMASAEKIMNYAKAEVIGRFNLPLFNENFSADTKTITNAELKDELNKQIAILTKQ